MLNLLTIDLEDYFQVHAFSDVIKFEDWGNYECRIERNTDRLLSILNDVTQNSTFKTQHSTLSTQNSPKGSFFVLGWLAERYPGLVRRIQKEGHEIACHGYAHRLVYAQSREEFREDVRKSKRILEDVIGQEVIGYRAPSYSITNKSQWAFEVLMEEGFKYDSSIFPIRHDFYGMPEAPRFPFVVSLNGNSNVEFSMLNFELNATQNSRLKTQNLAFNIEHSTLDPQPSPLAPRPSALSPQSSVLNASTVSAPQHSTTAAPPVDITRPSQLEVNNSLPHSLINSRGLLEFPLSTVKLFGTNFPIAGGGYFRLFPYSLIRKGLKSINAKEGKPFIFYMHPWEIDPKQPRINGVSSRSRFRHYVNLDKTESRFRNLLGDFQFSPIRQLLIEASQLKTHS